jgi:hypothetical protein
MTSKVPVSTCRCGARNDASTCADGTNTVPTPGDLSCCIYCGQISQYGPDLLLQPLSEDDIDVLVEQQPGLGQMLLQARVIGWAWQAKRSQPHP